MIYVLNIDDYSIQELTMDMFIHKYNTDDLSQVNTYLCLTREQAEKCARDLIGGEDELLAL